MRERRSGISCPHAGTSATVDEQLKPRNVVTQVEVTGDAPIIEVLRLIRDNKWPIVALLEFEHGTLRTGTEEVQLMFDYCKRALA